MKTSFRLIRCLFFILMPVFITLAGDQIPFNSKAVPLGNVLNPDGTLDLKSGFSGSLNPSGYKMVLRPDGKPIFVPRAKPMGIPPTVSGDESWSSQFLLPGVDDAVYAIAEYGTNLYLGGNFSIAGELSAIGLVKWDGSSWSAIGNMNTGMYSCLALAVDGSGNLYAGGSFSTIGGVSALSVAMYNGSTWSALDGGIGGGGWVQAIAVSGSDVYVGGYFTSVDGGSLSANYAARWDGSNWNRLGTAAKNGVNNVVYSIVANGSNVYLGGDFTTAYNTSSDLTVNCITRWDGSAFNQLGTGASGSGTPTVKALATDGTNIYAGGAFSSMGGVSAANIAKWNGSSWSALGTGTNNAVNSILFKDASNIYIGGDFTSADGSARKYIARWNSSSWQDVGGGTGGSVSVIAGSSIYAGGSFRTAGTIGASYIARWNSTSSTWENVGVSTTNGIEKDGYVNCITVDGTNMYVGGNFKSVGKLAANNIAKWNGSSWSLLTHTPSGQNGTDAEVSAIAVLGSDVYVGGGFTTAGGSVGANRIAKFNGSEWSAMGTGMNNIVYAIGIMDASNIYAGGLFTTAGGITANYFAKWNGSVWSAVGTGTDISGGGTTKVNAIAVYGSLVYIGGNFTSPGNYVAKWDGSNWSSLGSGMNGIVYALTMQDADLLAGGAFTTAGGSTAKRIAKWNGSAWSTIGSGTNEGTDGTIYAITVSGSDIYVGGLFLNAGTTAANRIAKWNGSAWLAYGSGANDQVNAIGLGSVYIGGRFTTAGGKPSYYFGKYSEASSAVLLETKIFLEGPYNTTSNEMSTSLKDGGYIPTTAPYTEDARVVDPIPANVTDWVLIQLRSTPSGAAVVSKSAFLNKDGRVVADDGTTGVISLSTSEGDYYIVAKQRNHLAVMSAGMRHLIAESTELYDFTVGTEKYYGGEAKQVDTSPSTYGMYAGDPNKSGLINSADYLTVKSKIGSSGYWDNDCNLSSLVNSADYLVVKPNVGKTTNIP